MAAPRLPAWTRPSFTWMDQATRLDSPGPKGPWNHYPTRPHTPAGQGSGLLVKLAVFDRDLAADTLGKKPERFGLFAEPIERPGLWEDRELVERSAGFGAGKKGRVG